MPCLAPLSDSVDNSHSPMRSELLQEQVLSSALARFNVRSLIPKFLGSVKSQVAACGPSFNCSRRNSIASSRVVRSSED